MSFFAALIPEDFFDIRFGNRKVFKKVVVGILTRKNPHTAEIGKHISNYYLVVNMNALLNSKMFASTPPAVELPDVRFDITYHLECTIDDLVTLTKKEDGPFLYTKKHFPEYHVCSAKDPALDGIVHLHEASEESIE